MLDRLLFLFGKTSEDYLVKSGWERIRVNGDLVCYEKGREGILYNPTKNRIVDKYPVHVKHHVNNSFFPSK